jgi:hypothetical protein
MPRMEMTERAAPTTNQPKQAIEVRKKVKETVRTLVLRFLRYLCLTVSSSGARVDSGRTTDPLYLYLNAGRGA